MLKPVHRLNCRPALAACRQLMQRFALWLCEPAVRGADVDRANLRTRMPSSIEADWLWELLGRVSGEQTLLDRARAVADLPGSEKQGLAAWIRAVVDIAQHFSAQPPAALPCRPPNAWTARGSKWTSFRTLMVSFYEIGLKEMGVPYRCDGAPTGTASERVDYEDFVAEFRLRHRLDPHPDAYEVCVLCGGLLNRSHVDHWVSKSEFPILAVCADNLLPSCDDCNEAPNKGQKKVHTDGRFDDWFHPYLRHPNGEIHLQYVRAEFAIKVDSHSPENQRRAETLDELLNLGERWTRKFKAEVHLKEQEVARRKAERAARGLPPLDAASLRSMLLDYRDSLNDQSPDFEVRRVVAYVLLEPARIQALLTPLEP